MRAAEFVTERKKKKRKNRYFGGYWYPGYGYYGSGAYGGESGDSSGGDGGGESVSEDVFNGIELSIETVKDDEYVDDNDYNNQVLYVKATSGGRELGHVLFAFDGEYLLPQDLEVDERFQGQGIAATMYDYVKSKGYKIRRSGQQTDAGAGFWNKHRPEQNVWEDSKSSDSVIFIGDNVAIVGQQHGKQLQLSDQDAEQVQAIAQRYGAWYEGNGMDRELTKGIIDNYQGSWDDDLLSPAIKGYPAPFLYVLFSNIEANDTVEGKIGSDPESTIFDRILSTQPNTNYFPDRQFDAETLTKFLQAVSEGPYDFVQMSQSPATKRNVRRFFTLGEKLMFPDNWEEYPYRAGRVAKSVNDLRDKFLATRKRGVYVAGSDHLRAVQQFLDQNKQDVTEDYDNTTFKIKRRKLNVPALIEAGAILITYPHGEQGWETDDERDWSFSLITLYNVLKGGWTSEAKKYLKPESYRQAEQQINSSAPNLGSDQLVYDGKYNQILWSIKKLGIPDNVAFLDKGQQGVVENFADGKIKGRSRPGRVKRAGASCAGSVTSLRQKAKNTGGERAKMYHWCANMKSGRKK